MPLEFSCYRCGQRITIPDGLPEQMIPCPKCGALIAHGGTDAAAAHRAQYPGPDEFRQVPPSEPRITPFTISSVLEDAWNIGIKRWQPFLLLGVIVSGLNIALFASIYVVSIFFLYAGAIGYGIMNHDSLSDVYKPSRYQLAQGFFDDETNITESDPTPDPAHILENWEHRIEADNPQLSPESVRIGLIFTVVVGLVILFLSLIASLVYCWIYVGQILLGLSAVRGEKAQISLLFGGWKYLWRIVLVCANRTILYMLAWFLIFAITFFPVLYYVATLGPDFQPSNMGIVFIVSEILLGSLLILFCTLYIGIMFTLSDYFVIDRNQGAIEAMRSSYIFVRPHFWRVLGLTLLIGIFTSIVVSIPMIGFIFVPPIAIVFWSVFYLKITGQKNCLVPEEMPTSANNAAPPPLA